MAQDPEKARQNSRKYYQKNKEKIAERNREYTENNKEKIVEYQRNYRENNKENLLENAREYYQNNKEKIIESTREYRKNNKEKLNKISREYHHRNREKRKEQSREYYQNNKEKMAEYGRDYRQNNKEKMAEYGRDYRQNNKEKLNEYRITPKVKMFSVNYCAKKRGSKGMISLKHFKILMNLNKCHVPNCQHTDNLEYDHKIPISKGGLNIDSNLWTLCPNHHSEKTKYDKGLNPALKPDWLDIDYKIEEVEKPKPAQLSLF